MSWAERTEIERDVNDINHKINVKEFSKDSVHSVAASSKVKEATQETGLLSPSRGRCATVCPADMVLCVA